MTIYKRRIIAYIIGKLVGGKEIYRVFDKATFSFNQIAGEISTSRINVYDTERNELMTGSGDNNGISLYDYTSAKIIDLKIEGEVFHGFDYESKKLFFGDMKGHTVSLFDFQDSRHHYYIMMAENENISSENFGLLI